MRDKRISRKFPQSFKLLLILLLIVVRDKYKYEANIIDEMWPQIQCPGIVSYIYAVKIAQLQIPVKYIILLQNIATQLPSIRGKTNISMNLSELGHHADVQYTRKGPAPLSGVFKLGRRIFIGRYPGTWGSK